jgi:hypothetical protein
MNKNEIVKMLESDLDSLMKKRTKLIEGGEYKQSIELTRVIKETLTLLDTYGWRQAYSIYKILNANGSGGFVDMISVWDENQDGNVANCRVFSLGAEYVDVESDYTVYTNKYTKPSTDSDTFNS